MLLLGNACDFLIGPNMEGMSLLVDLNGSTHGWEYCMSSTRLEDRNNHYIVQWVSQPSSAIYAKMLRLLHLVSLSVMK